jgi:hypothetical protein
MTIRISAILALIYGLLIVVSVFVPLFYGLPLNFGIHVGDIIPAVTCISLLAGGFLALFRYRSSILIAAWAWSLALQTSGLVHLLIHPSDFSAAIAKAGNAAQQASMRQILEQAARMDLHIQLAYCVAALVGLLLVLLGNAEGRLQEPDED